MKIHSIFNATGNVNLKDLTKNILIKSQNIYFDTKNQTVKSNVETSIKDNLGNQYFNDKVLITEIQKSNLIKINDAKDN